MTVAINNQLSKFQVNKVKLDVRFSVLSDMGHICVTFKFAYNKPKLSIFVQDENLLCTLLLGSEIGTSIILERLSNNIKVTLLNKTRVIVLLDKEEFKALANGCCHSDEYSMVLEAKVYY